MQAVDLEVGPAEDGAEFAPGVDPDRVGEMVARDVGVPIVPQCAVELVADVGEECPAEGDVDHLDAAADAQEGDAALGRQARQGQIEKIPLGRMARPDEIWAGLRFIIECDYFTGRIIAIDGGATFL